MVGHWIRIEARRRRKEYLGFFKKLRRITLYAKLEVSEMISPGFFSGLETLEVVTCSSLNTVSFAPQRDANGITSVYYWNKRRK